jgi:hypothetical protein
MAWRTIISIPDYRWTPGDAVLVRREAVVECVFQAIERYISE